MTYTVEEDPNVPDDVEAGAIDSASYMRNSVRYGLGLSDGNTESTISDYNLNMAAGEAYVNKTFFGSAAVVDFDYLGAGVDAAGDPAVVVSADGLDVIAVIVLAYAAGTPAVKAVFGAEAATGTAVAPTTAEITAGLGEGTWIELGRVLIARTATDVLTETWTDTRVTP
jgi:hypothetical protein